MTLASIPSPAHAAWRLGPLPVRVQALCVIAGIGVAIFVAARRHQRPGVILDVAAWAIPFGLIGVFLHAMLLDIGHNHGLWHALTAATAAIGVPGAVGIGAVGAGIACRRAGVGFSRVAGAAAPAVAFGLAVGGLGNWWTQQFYGRPSSWWWAVQISPARRVPGYENYGTFQPVFGYLSLWEVALGLALIMVSRKSPAPRAFALGAAGYAVGAFWADSARIGPLPHVLGIRYGALIDVAIFALAVVGLYLTRSRRAPRAYRKPDPVTLVDDSSGDVMST